MDEPLIFLGAGASKPFGIPTMKEMVIEFEKELKKNASIQEQELYRYIKNLLEDRYKGPVDLETVFSLIEEISQGITFKKLGDPALFYQRRYLKKSAGLKTYKERRNKDVKNASALKKKFENFFREKCHISRTSIGKVESLYTEFFTKLTNMGNIKINEDQISGGSTFYVPRGRFHMRNWSIFTTNYDQAIEIFCSRFEIDLNTGFSPRYQKFILNPQTFSDIHRMSLFKLHGSINWKKEDNGEIVSYPTPPGSQTTYDGRQILGEVMIYPISEKYIYRNPFTYMFYQLNERLKNTRCWVIVGYSFRDPAIKNLFIENATDKKKIVVLHPHADEVIKNELPEILKGGNIFPLNKNFGEERTIDELVNIIQTN